MKITSYRIAILCLMGILAACGDKDETQIIEGDRIDLVSDQTARIRSSNEAINLPEPIMNNDWSQISGLPFNDIGNLSAIEGFDKARKIFIGNTKDGHNEVTMQPVFVAGFGYFFTVDSKIIAFDLKSGKKVWTQKVSLDDSDGNPRGGGLASDGRNVYIATSNGIIAAFNCETGKEEWRLYNKIPISAAPTLSEGLLFVIDRDNRLQVINTHTGFVLWDHKGLPEPAAYSRVASAAVFGPVLVVPFTSGEMTAINLATQKPAWGQTLIGGGLNPGGLQFNTISSEIVISDRKIFASVPSGITVALEGMTGRTLWQHEIGSSKNILSVSNVLYVLDTSAKLYALDKNQGGVIWYQQLEQYENPEEYEDPIEWTSPIMSHGKIILMSNYGKAVILDGLTGNIIQKIEDGPKTIIDPLIVAGKLMVYDKKGFLHIYDD